MLLTESVPVEWVTRAPLFKVGITTSSPVPGNADVLQLLAVLQSPPAGLIQVIVAGITRSSRISISGRRALSCLTRSRLGCLWIEENKRFRTPFSQEDLIIVVSPRD